MNTALKTSLALVFGLACVSGSYAATDTTSGTTPTDTTKAPAEMRDGFMMKNSQVMITQDGKSKVVEDDMKLANGIVVRSDGTVIVPGGVTRTLKEGDTLTFDGALTRADSGKVEHLNPH